jgi:hypothetical protein
MSIYCGHVHPWSNIVKRMRLNKQNVTETHPYAGRLFEQLCTCLQFSALASPSPSSLSSHLSLTFDIFRLSQPSNIDLQGGRLVVK